MSRQSDLVELTRKKAQALSSGSKNILINGGLDISQRGTYGSATTMINNTYYVDRFRVGLGTGSAGTIQRTTVVLPGGHAAKAVKLVSTATTTSGYMTLRHTIEDFRMLTGRTVTASAWVRTNIEGYTFRHDSTANFGDTFPADGNWHRVSATYTFGTIASAGIGANQTTLAIINYTGTQGAGEATGDYIEIAQIQLEFGSEATDFERVPLSIEMAKCQRYFCQTTPTGMYVASNQSSYPRWNGFWPVSMRTGPSITIKSDNITSGWSFQTYYWGYAAYNANGGNAYTPSFIADAEF